jgi:ribosome-binding factor A
MPKEYSRGTRVAEQIKRELAKMIQFEVKDPRVGFVSLTDVELTPDYAHAKVFFTSLRGQAEAEGALIGLRSASGFLRRELGRRVRIHTTPELHFVYDASIEHGSMLSALIDKAVAENRAQRGDEDVADDAQDPQA